MDHAAKVLENLGAWETASMLRMVELNPMQAAAPQLYEALKEILAIPDRPPLTAREVHIKRVARAALALVEDK